MRFISFFLSVLLTLSVHAQTNTEDARPKNQMSAIDRLVLDSEMMRSPVYTKRAYRRAQQLDRAVEQKQAAYLQQQKKEKQLTEDEFEKEQERLKKMRLMDYGMADVDLKAQSAQITQDPVQSFYDLSRNVKTGGYGKTVEELKAEKAARAEAQVAQTGLTPEEYQAALAEEKKRSNPLGKKTITVSPNAFK